MPLDQDVIRLAKGNNPIGPQGRVILKIAPDKINTPGRPGRP